MFMLKKSALGSRTECVVCRTVKYWVCHADKAVGPATVRVRLSVHATIQNGIHWNCKTEYDGMVKRNTLEWWGVYVRAPTEEEVWQGRTYRASHTHSIVYDIYILYCTSYRKFMFYLLV